MAPIIATILTGFLGSGKTTLLNRVLRDSHGHRIAVIENEYGTEDIDSEILLSDTQQRIVQMSNGCICCTIRDDLRSMLCSLADKRRRGELDFDRVVIETTGLADPGPVTQTFFVDTAVVQDYLLDSILTLVDARHAPQTLDHRQEARRQIGFADRIFVSKADLVDRHALNALMNRLKHMNPRAAQKVVHFGQVDLADVLDLRAFNMTATLDIEPAFLQDDQADQADQDDRHNDAEQRHEHGRACDSSTHHGNAAHHHHDDDVKSFVFRSDRPFDGSRLSAVVAALANNYGPRLLRYKGVLNLFGVDRKVILQGVHQLTSSDVGPLWAHGEPRISKLVFIGIDMPRQLVLQTLEQCLV